METTSKIELRDGLSEASQRMEQTVPSESSGSVELIATQELLRRFVRRCAPNCKPGAWDYDKKMASMCESASKLLGDGCPWK